MTYPPEDPEGRKMIEAAEEKTHDASLRSMAARGKETPERVAELAAESEAAESELTEIQEAHPVTWADLDSDRAWETQQDALYGTEAERNAEAAIDEAEEILSAEVARYDWETTFFPDPEPPGPEPPEPEAGD
jgi:hypothetical protein